MLKGVNSKLNPKWLLQQIAEQWQRDLVYLCAVAKFKLRSYLAAREQLTELLKVRVLGFRVLGFSSSCSLSPCS